MKHLVVVLDGLAAICAAAICFVAITGGAQFHVLGAKVSLHHPENPAIALFALMGLRLLALPRSSLGDSPVIRKIATGLTRISRRLASPHAGHLAVAITAYSIIMGCVVVRRHLTFHSHAFDLGIFDQLIWNAARGHDLHSSLLNQHFLGHHFSPILYLIVPLYWLAGTPISLILLQTIVLALGAIPVWWYAAKKLGDKRWALAFASAYLAYQPLRNVNLFDFHEIAMATPLLLFALWYFSENRHGAGCAALMAAAACKEEVLAIVFCFGLYLVLSQRKRLIGSLLMFGGIGGFFAILLLVIPYFGEGEYAFLHRYGYLGSSLPEIVKTLVTRPGYVLAHTLTSEKLTYALQVFGPMMLLPLVSPTILLAGASTLLQNLLSDYQYQFSIKAQYTAPLIPFVLFAAVDGMRRSLHGDSWLGARLLKSKQCSVSTVACAWLVICSLAFAGKWPIALLREFKTPANAAAIARAMSLIPVDAALSAQDRLVPHLSQRSTIRLFPNIDGCEYVLLDRLGSRWPLTAEEYEPRVRSLTEGGYAIVYENAGVLLLHRFPSQ